MDLERLSGQVTLVHRHIGSINQNGVRGKSIRLLEGVDVANNQLFTINQLVLVTVAEHGELLARGGGHLLGDFLFSNIVVRRAYDDDDQERHGDGSTLSQTFGSILCQVYSARHNGSDEQDPIDRIVKVLANDFTETLDLGRRELISAIVCLPLFDRSSIDTFCSVWIVRAIKTLEETINASKFLNEVT